MDNFDLSIPQPSRSLPTFREQALAIKAEHGLCKGPLHYTQCGNVFALQCSGCGGGPWRLNAAHGLDGRCLGPGEAL
jgi:hypothetical protein